MHAVAISNDKSRPNLHAARVLITTCKKLSVVVYWASSVCQVKKCHVEWWLRQRFCCFFLDRWFARNADSCARHNGPASFTHTTSPQSRWSSFAKHPLWKVWPHRSVQLSPLPPCSRPLQIPHSACDAGVCAAAVSSTLNRGIYDISIIAS